MGGPETLPPCLDPHMIQMINVLKVYPNKWHVCPAKSQNCLDFCPVLSESLLWHACIRFMGPAFLHADWEDNHQIGRMSKVFLHRLTNKSFRRIGIAVDHILNKASAPVDFIG